MKKSFLPIVFIGLLLTVGLIVVGCDWLMGNCDGDCVMRANIYGQRTEYKNCAGIMCDVSNHHLDNPYNTGHPAFANITCNCK